MHRPWYSKLIGSSILAVLLLVLPSYATSLENNNINIISPSNNSQVQTGNLTITGTALYDSSKPCHVYATWNNSHSERYPVSIIDDGKNYSLWKFTYGPTSHEIIKGPNTLTAILSCVNSQYDNLTRLSSIIVNGFEKSDNSKNLTDIGSEISEIIPTTRSINPLENGNVFSSNNFELAIPFTMENSTEYYYPSMNKLEIVNRTSIIGTLQDNETLTSAVPPSLLEVGSNQDKKSLSLSNVTQVDADAGPDQTVYEGTPVILNGSNSKSINNVILSYEWKQVPNPTITVGGAKTMIWSFIAPYVTTDTTLTFELVVTNDKGITSTDEVDIIVRNGNKNISKLEMTNGILMRESQNKESDTQPKTRNLIIQSLVDKNPVSIGEKQVIKIDLFDANTDDRINNATITGQILDSSEKIIKEFSEDNHSFELSLDIPENAKSGNYMIRLNASAPGYISSYTDTNFKVKK